MADLPPYDDFFGKFDEFVTKHNIQPDEMGEAFAAYLNGLGWNGEAKEVTNG